MPKFLNGFFLCSFLWATIPIISMAEDGYRLWLRYDLISDDLIRTDYQETITELQIIGVSKTIEIVQQELSLGLLGLLGKEVPIGLEFADGQVVAGTYSPTGPLSEILTPNEVQHLGDDGFSIVTKSINNRRVIIITALHDIGVLYGTYHFLRLLQTNKSIANLNISEVPKVQVRMLNHWDNLDRTVERGYAGFSIWNWPQLPEYIDPRFVQYARANASIGINGVALTNVNANALVLRPDYLMKVKALADVLRPYGVKVYLTARFSAPIELGNLQTADPLGPNVQEWWNTKADEIYELIPDFGGFVIKANSEGQPGPHDYNRTHADGANMLAQAVGKYGGIIIWRAFVYSSEKSDDRHEQSSDEFLPLDGEFKSNVMVQVKNGAIDFQPREPFHPLFGMMKETPLMMEFQITQEYLGQGTHLVFLGNYWKEVLDSDTYTKGKGSSVASIVEGAQSDQILSGFAGVANIGTDRNWTGHPFGQSNWYAFGRLSWNHSFSANEIAREWVQMTFTTNDSIVTSITDLMMASHEAIVNYMTPLGLHHIMAADHHYGPGPWVEEMSRADWNSTYYHQADTVGIGFDRTEEGTDALSQYDRQLYRIWSDPQNCPEKYLLWFHHLPWTYPMQSGHTLWEELCLKYQEGVEQVTNSKRVWDHLTDDIDTERYDHVSALLNIQLKEARWWRDACLLYFQTFSAMELPEGIPAPAHDLEHYIGLDFPTAPGIKPSW
ncbi:UNVERIFIED_CONTAM: hypothetical protein GTU68_048670 [Idotea baltica]|nr:hypothetical protein [Idotea baltica]